MYIAIFQESVGSREMTFHNMNVIPYRSDEFDRNHTILHFNRTLPDGSELRIYRINEAHIDNYDHPPVHIMKLQLNSYADIVQNLAGFMVSLNSHEIAILSAQPSPNEIQYVAANQSLRRLSVTHQGTKRTLAQRDDIIQKAHDELSRIGNSFTGLEQAIKALETVQAKLAASLVKLKEVRKIRGKLGSVGSELVDAGAESEEG